MLLKILQYTGQDTQQRILWPQISITLILSKPDLDYMSRHEIYESLGSPKFKLTR